MAIHKPCQCELRIQRKEILTKFKWWEKKVQEKTMNVPYVANLKNVKSKYRTFVVKRKNMKQNGQPMLTK
jgi:hypothetical protein